MIQQEIPDKEILTIPCLSLHQASDMAARMALQLREMTTYYDDHHVVSVIDRKSEELPFLIRNFLKREGIGGARTYTGQDPYRWREITLEDGTSLAACSATERNCRLLSPFMRMALHPFHFSWYGLKDRKDEFQYLWEQTASFDERIPLKKGEAPEGLHTWYAFFVPHTENRMAAIAPAHMEKERIRIIGSGTDRPVMTLFQGDTFQGVENMGTLAGREYHALLRFASERETRCLEDHFRRLCWGRQLQAEEAFEKEEADMQEQYKTFRR